jgi:hypothetical protein
MKANVVLAIGLSGAMLTLASAVHLGATPAVGFTGTTIATGRFSDFDADNHGFFPALTPSNLRSGKDVLQRTKAPSDLYVQSNVWTPGGTTGWHTHPGRSLIIVTAGTITAYDAEDRTCAPHRYSVGEGFVDEGGDHVHVLRNEQAVEARTVAVQLIPADATRRIDAATSPHCGF